MTPNRFSREIVKPYMAAVPKEATVRLRKKFQRSFRRIGNRMKKASEGRTIQRVLEARAETFSTFLVSK